MNKSRPILTIAVALVAVAVAFLTGCESPSPVRIATFNTALSRDTQGALHAAFARGDDAKAKLVAEVLQRTRPDIVLLQEVDYDPTGQAYADFQRNYLGVSQNGAERIHYDYVYAPPVNTGVLADVDLDGDGKITRPNDCYGFGKFDGHYGMVVLSRYPIDLAKVRTFREALWKDMPGSQLPADYYSAQAQSRLRLSSKTHADVPITLNNQEIHLLISHPTPPVFDGPEDRNGRRNFDEIGFWIHYISSGLPRMQLPTYPRIDRTTRVGSMSWSKRFVILGDLNADPNDGESRPGAANQLLTSLIVNSSVAPTSTGAREAARIEGRANLTHKTDPATDTADWNDDPARGSGNLRVDYVLPSKNLNVTGSGVYWLTRDDPHAYLNDASDHHLVWIDVDPD